MRATTHIDDAPRRALRRGLTLPSGRAVVGALLVALAVVGLFAAAGRGEPGPTSIVVVAALPVAPGQVITAEDLRTTPVTLPAELAAQTISDPDAVVGAVSLAPLAPGELVQLSALRRGGAVGASPEVSVRLPAARALDGRIQRGETVDLVATLGPSGDACTSVIVTGAVVANTSGAGDKLLSAPDDLTLTLALRSMDEVLATVHASDQGKLTIVRSSPAPDTAPGGTPPGGAPVCAGDTGSAER